MELLLASSIEQRLSSTALSLGLWRLLIPGCALQGHNTHSISHVTHSKKSYTSGSKHSQQTSHTQRRDCITWKPIGLLCKAIPSGTHIIHPQTGQTGLQKHDTIAGPHTVQVDTHTHIHTHKNESNWLALPIQELRCICSTWLKAPMTREVRDNIVRKQTN